MKLQRLVGFVSRQQRILLLLSIAMLTLSASSPQERTDKLLLLFEKHKQLYPQEKVYLHTDKPYYMIGDTIWFAGYVVNAVSNTPTEYSNILYVDLINSSAQVVAQQKWKVHDGFTNGQIPLIDTLSQDVYTLRAYTAWMCNFDSSYFFTKQINVFQLFPEDFRCQASLDTGVLRLGLAYNDVNVNTVKNCSVKYRIKSGKFSAKGESIIDSVGNWLLLQLVNNKLIDGATVELQYTDNANKKQKKVVAFKLPCKPELSVRFYPEGGQLIEGFSSRVAFEVRDEKGEPLVIKGTLSSIEVESNFAGYGSVLITPKENEKRTFSVNYNGKEYVFFLPTAKKHGATLTCDNSTAGELKVKIQGRFEQQEQSKNMLLVGHVRGNPAFILPINLNSNGVAQAKILTASYPQGVMHITLIDGLGLPCAERLVYIDQGKRVNVTFSTNKNEFLTREQTTVNITTTDQSGKPVPAHISLTAVDESQLILPDSTEENIYSYLSLSSDLQGKIYKPNHYFSSAATAKSDLDLLLLTQGWRRFNIELCNVDSCPPIKYPLEKQLALTAKVSGVSKKKMQDYTATLFTYTNDNKKHGIYRNAPTSEGNLSFVFDDFFEELKAVVSTRNRRDRLSTLDLNLTHVPQPSFSPLRDILDLNLLAQENQKILDQRLYMESLIDRPIMLKNVMVYSQAHTAQEYQAMDIGHLASFIPPNYVLERKDIVKFDKYDGAVLKAMLAKSPEMREIKNDEGGAIIIFKSLIHGGSADIWIDRAPFEDTEYLWLLKSKDIASIRIYMPSVMSPVGLVSITTTIPPIGVVMTTLKGFERAREFYAPLNVEEGKSDYRTTVFWQANIRTDSTGHASVVMQNTSNAGSVRLRAEGLTRQGVPAFGEGKYKVKTK